MIDYKKAFIDTAPFIYFIEKDVNNPQYFDKVKQFLIDGHGNSVCFVTSVITVMEYMVFPYRSHQEKYVEIFERLIRDINIDIVEVDKRTALMAARIRAEYKGFKAMDALQLALATVSGCDLFLTNDKQLRQYRRLTCITVDDL